MIAEAIESIQKLTTEANQLEVVELGEPSSVARVVKRDGTIELITKTPPHRRIDLHTISALAELAEKPIDKEAWSRRAVFYNANKITLVLDWKNGYEVAELALPPSKEAAFFMERMKEQRVSVSSLVEHLLTTLRKTRDPDAMEEFVARVGALATRNGEKTGAEASRTRTGIAQSVISEVEGPENLPPDLQTFIVRPFAVPDIGNRFPLTCTLLPRAAETCWLLKPQEDSWLEFQRDSLDALIGPFAKAKAAGVAFYCGTWSTLK